MSGDVAISQSASQSTQVPIPTTTTSTALSQDTVAGSLAASIASKRPLVNPSLHLDLALNLVVLQFIDDNGDVTNQIPTQQQLKAYQQQATSSSSVGSTSETTQSPQGTTTAQGKVVPAPTATSNLGPADLGSTGVPQYYGQVAVATQPHVTASTVTPSTAAPARSAAQGQSGV